MNSTHSLPPPANFTLTVFLLVVLVIAVLFVKMVLRVARPAGGGAPGAGGWIGIVLGFAAWLVVPAVLAVRGALDSYDPMPAPPLVMIMTLTLGTIVLALSPFGRLVAERFSLAALVGFQFFRVPVEWVLHWLAKEGIAPVQMTFAGRNFDIVSGITAALLACYLVGEGPNRRVVLLWNLLGLGLLANIITIAVLSTPAPFRAFMNEPANRLPSEFPWVWLPTFLVQAALFGHLVVFRALARRTASRT